MKAKHIACFYPYLPKGEEWQVKNTLFLSVILGESKNHPYALTEAHHWPGRAVLARLPTIPEGNCLFRRFKVYSMYEAANGG